MTLETIHASAVLVGETGILILGASGSGKSSLALDLIDHCHLRGIAAGLIGDDRIVILRKNGQIFASPAPQLAGLIEVFGSGVHLVRHIDEAEIHLAVRLVESSKSLRMPPQEPHEVLPGIFLPLLCLPQRQPAVRAVLAHLGLYGGVERVTK